MSFCDQRRAILCPGYACKMKAANAQRRSDDREIVAALNMFASYRLYVTQGIKNALCETEVLHRASQLTMFDQKSSVACHASEECFDRVYCIGVMETRHINSPVDSLDKLFKAGITRHHHRM